MNFKTNYNERSWAIDLIAYIKLYASSIERPIKEAGGESTVNNPDGSSLFPDVLLYGDSESAKILQGWELKMPDTNINDYEFYANAKKKAEVLGLDSFILWNVQSAYLYILNSDNQDFELAKVWDDITEIKTREDVKRYSNKWKKLCRKIIDTVNDYLDDGSLSGKRFIDAYSSGGITSLILENTDTLSDALVSKINTDKRFKAEVTLWLVKNSQEYGAKNEKRKIDALSRAILINWLGKFLFAHILTSSSSSARNLLKNIDNSTTVEEALDIFIQISNKCNFWTIFSTSIGMNLLPTSIWSDFLSLNNLLTDLRIGEIEQSQLSNILEETVSIGSRKLKGQYTTPKSLAKLLVALSINNLKEDKVADFCSGSGTIIREALEAKLKVCNSQEANNAIYASDLDYHANQMTTFALAKPNSIDIPIKVFNEDIFSLEPSYQVTIKDPRTGASHKEELGQFDAILGNLPFISQDGRKTFEDAIKAVVSTLPDKYDFLDNDVPLSLNKKSDIYAYIPFHVYSLLKEGGTLGIIISNSWLGTDWGIRFFKHLIGHYHLKTVITSGAGRWFNNSEVVTNILILEKRKSGDQSLGDIDFVTLKRPLADLESDDYLSVLSSQIISGSVNSSESLDIRTVNTSDVFDFLTLGVNLTSQFVNCDWLFGLPLIKMQKIIDSSRGKRRGWDALFYPSAKENIEEEFLEPVLLSSRSLQSYLVPADYDKRAFCCAFSEDELLAQGKMGAYNWIQKFKHSSNTKGEPLIETLKQSKNIYWYEFGKETKADLVVTMNPEKRFFIAKIQEPSIINQRLICIKIKDGQDIDLIHALLNTTVAYFLIEASGFGRGLGALDLKADNFKYMSMLDPNTLTESEKITIKEAFKPLLFDSRVVYNIDEELESEDRIAFDKVVLEAFGVAHLQNEIYDGLLKLVSIRLEAKNTY